MDPINYGIDVPSPMQSFGQGFQFTAGIREAQLKQEQQAQQLAAQQQMSRDLGDLSRNPTPQAIGAMSIRYPQLSEQFKRSYDMLKPEQQQAKLDAAMPVYAAALSGRPDIAAKKLRETAAAMESSGQTDEAKRTAAMADMFEQHPETASLQAGILLSSVMGPEKFAETFGKLGQEGRAVEKAPIELREATAKAGAAESDATIKAAQAGVAVPMAKAGADKAVADAAKAGSDATTAAVTAKYAEKNTLADLEAKGWNIKALQADIDYKRQASRIAAMNASIAREGNDLKRQELQLKVQEAQTALDDKVRGKVAEFESARSQIEDGYNLVRELQDNPELEQATGGLGVRALIPGTRARSIAGRIEQLQNSLASANLDKLKGAMSDKDIVFLKSMSANLDRLQDEGEFRRELKRIEEVFVRADKQLRTKVGAPTVSRASKSPAADASAAGGQKNIVVDW